MVIDTHNYAMQYQQTSLHYASESGHYDTVRVLLENGANPRACDKVRGNNVCYWLEYFVYMFTIIEKFHVYVASFVYVL